MYTLSVSKKFQRQLNKLSRQNPKLKTRVSKTLLLLIKDLKHPSLRLHKLSGKNTWSVSVSMSLCIIIGIRNKKIYLLRIGSHNEIY